MYTLHFSFLTKVYYFCSLLYIYISPIFFASSIKGEYQDQANQTSCLDCELNFFTNETNQLTCRACGVGESTSSKGSARCNACAAGKAGTPCTPCGEGKYREGDDTNKVTCTSCEVGHYQPKLGQAGCLPCIPGSFTDLEAQTECKECNANTFANETEQTSCKDCDVGTSSIKGSAVCQACGAGTYGEGCLPCLEGKFRKASDSPLMCRPCETGTYQNEKGQAACLPCIPGQYQDVPGETKCKKCKVGQHDAGKVITAIRDAPAMCEECKYQMYFSCFPINTPHQYQFVLYTVPF